MSSVETRGRRGMREQERTARETNQREITVGTRDRASSRCVSKRLLGCAICKVRLRGLLSGTSSRVYSCRLCGRIQLQDLCTCLISHLPPYNTPSRGFPIDHPTLLLPLSLLLPSRHCLSSPPPGSHSPFLHLRASCLPTVQITRAPNQCALALRL